ERRSPNRDVPLETGDPSDMFSQARHQTDLVDQARQLPQREPEPDDDRNLEVTISASFASGLNRSADLKGAIDAGVPFGVDVGLIAPQQIDEIAEALANGVKVFVDSGAFRLFRESQRNRARSGQVEVF